MNRTYLEPTREAAIALIDRGITDYSATPGLALPSEITGESAYRLYMDHTLPLLQASGGDEDDLPHRDKVSEAVHAHRDKRYARSS
jgi:hypothetical protein